MHNSFSSWSVIEATIAGLQTLQGFMPKREVARGKENEALSVISAGCILVHARLGAPDDCPLEHERARSQGSSVHQEAGHEGDQEAEEACPRARSPEQSKAIRTHHSLQGKK